MQNCAWPWCESVAQGSIRVYAGGEGRGGGRKRESESEECGARFSLEMSPTSPQNSLPDTGAVALEYPQGIGIIPNWNERNISMTRAGGDRRACAVVDSPLPLESSTTLVRRVLANYLHS